MTLYNELMNLIKGENDEVLNEIKIANYNTYTISVYGDGASYRGFDKEPYFKFYIGQSARKCSKLVRVSILRAAFIRHNGGERR